MNKVSKFNIDGTQYNVKDETAVNYDILVDKNGNGDYTTVAAAVENASDGQTIFIKNGVYDDEIINAVGKKLTIIGESRYGVIIQNSTGAYATPPLNIGKGILKNLSIKQNNSRTDQIGAYAVHTDNGDLLDNELIIDNCYLYSKCQSAIGIGLRPNGNITILNSYMYSENERLSDTENGAIICHTSISPEGTNQILRLINCFVHSKNTCAVKLTSCGSASNKGYLECYNTTLYSDYFTQTEKLIVHELNSGCTTHNMLLSDKNSNNSPILNTPIYSFDKSVVIGRIIKNGVEYPVKQKSFELNATSPWSSPIVIKFNTQLENYNDLINFEGHFKANGGLVMPFGYHDGNGASEGNFSRVYVNASLKEAIMSASEPGKFIVNIIYY